MTVGPLGINAFRVEEEVDFGSLAAADPVALHGADLLRPAVEFVEAIEEFLGISGDAIEPLHEVTLLDEGVLMAPATAIDDLLVGKDSGALGAPVNFALFAIGQALFIHAQEEPLVPAVVVGQAGGDLCGPVVTETEDAASAASWRRCWPGSTRAGACCF